MEKQTLKFHFMQDPDGIRYRLLLNIGPVGHAGKIETLEVWPCNGYSREKAMSRADKLVGQFTRRENADHSNGVIVIYTHDNYVKQAKDDPEPKESQLKPGSWRDSPVEHLADKELGEA